MKSGMSKGLIYAGLLLALLFAGTTYVTFAQSGKWQIQYDSEADRALGLSGKTLRGSFGTLMECETVRKARSAFEQGHCKCVRSDVSGAVLALPKESAPPAPVVAPPSEPAVPPEEAVQEQPVRRTVRNSNASVSESESSASAESTASSESSASVETSTPSVVFAPQTEPMIPKVIIQKGHTDQIDAVAYSPDGRFILSGSADRTLILHDATTGDEIRTFTGIEDRVSSAVFTPDGSYVVSGDEGHGSNVRLWQVSTGKQVSSFEGAFDMVFSVAVSPDGEYVAAGSGDFVYIWNRNDGTLIHTLKGHSGWVRVVAYSPDGRFIFSGGDDKMVKMWDVSTGKEVRSFRGHKEIIYSLAVTPDGRKILSGSYNDAPRLWNVATGALEKVLEGLESASLAVSPDGTKAVIGGFMKVVLWDLEKGKEQKTIEDSQAWIRAVSFSPDGLTMATAADEGALSLRKASSGKLIWREGGGVSPVAAGAVSSDGGMLAVARDYGTFDIWDLSGAAHTRSLTHSMGTNTLLLTSSGNIIAGGWDHVKQATSLKVWNSYADEPVGEQNIPGGAWVKTAALSADETVFAWAERSNLYVSDATDGRVLLTIKAAHQYDIEQVSINSLYILSKDQTDIMKLWNRETGALIHTFEGYDGVLSADGMTLFLMRQDFVRNKLLLQFWDCATETETKSMELDCTLTTSFGQGGKRYQYIDWVALSPDNGYFLWSSDNELHFGNLSTGTEIYVLRGHTSRITSIGFCGGGLRAYSCSEDGTTRFWNLETGQEAARLVTFPDGEWVAVTPEGYYNASKKGIDYLRYTEGDALFNMEDYADTYLNASMVQAAMMGNVGTYIPVSDSLSAPMFSFGLFEILFILLFIGVLFLIAFIDILRSEFTGSNKLIWLLVIVPLPILGPILYFFIGRKQKVKVQG